MLFNKLSIRLLFVIVTVTNSFIIPQDLSPGIKLIKNEKYNEATDYFKALLNSQKKAEACFYLGQIFYLKGNYDSAKTYFSNSITYNPKSGLGYAGMVKVNFAQNNESEAKANTEKAIEINNNNDPLVFLTLAEAYAGTDVKNYTKAIELLTNALSILPDYTDAYVTLGNIYLSKGDGSESIKNFEKAINIQKSDPEALTQKAKVYALINNDEASIKLLNEAITKDSTYAPAYNVLAELYASEKKYDSASNIYKKYLSFSEESPVKLKRYAQILYINREYKKVIQVLEGSNSEIDAVSSLRMLAYSYLRIENFDKSKKYFEKLFEMPNVEYLTSDYENYADLLSKIGDEEGALSCLNKIVDMDSTRDDIFSKISVLNFKNKNWYGVINALNSKKTLTAQEYFDLSKAYIFSGDAVINDLIERLKNFVGLIDEQPIKIRTSLLYFQKNMYNANKNGTSKNDAVDKLNQSVESLIMPNQKAKWAANKIKWLEDAKRNIKSDYSKADSLLTILINKSPNLPIGYLWKARVNANFDPESESGLAKPFYEQFIQIASNESDKYKNELIESYSYLGYYYYLQNDKSKSKANWQEVLDIDPANKQANDVIKQMK